MIMSIAVNDRIRYRHYNIKTGEKAIKIGIVEAYSWHANFCEIHLDNGDCISDCQILQFL